MRKRAQANTPAILAKNWRRWTAIVEDFARRRRGRHWVSPRAYHTLHLELLQVCHTLASAAENGHGDFYRELANIAQPWLTPRALAQAEHEILSDLLLLCRQVERKLAQRAWVVAALQWVKRGSAVLGGAAVAALLAWGGAEIWRRVEDPIQAWARLGWLAFKQTGEFHGMLIVGVIAIPVSMYLISRLARS
jgi:hypothetical protein